MDVQMRNAKDDWPACGDYETGVMRPDDDEVAGVGSGAFGARDRDRELRERYLIDLALLAMALPLLVFAQANAATAETRLGDYLDKLLALWGEDAKVPGAEPVAVGSVSDTMAVTSIAAQPAGMGSAQRPTSSGMERSDGDDAFVAGFAADIEAPSTLDHIWNSGLQNAGHGSGPVGGSGGVGHNTAVGVSGADIFWLDGDGNGIAEAGAIDPAAMLEAGFWAIVSDLIEIYPELLGALSSLVAVDEAGDAGSGLSVDTGGAAVSVGEVAIVDGDIYGILHHNSELTIATGYTYFEALSYTIDGQLAQTEALSWAEFTAADIILTMRQESDSASGQQAMSTSRIDYYALDYADWEPEGAAVHVAIDGGSATGHASPQISEWTPSKFAAVTAEVMAVAPNSIASVTTHSFAQDNLYTSVSAQALFGGTV